MSRKNEKPAEEAQAIDLTPMLDVVFIMLIFFIVTATFIKETGAAKTLVFPAGFRLAAIKGLTPSIVINTNKTAAIRYLFSIKSKIYNFLTKLYIILNYSTFLKNKCKINHSLQIK